MYRQRHSRPDWKAVAATYRAEDDAYYVLDKPGSVSMRLMRVERGLRAVELVRWTTGAAMTRFGITTGNDGSLVITSSNASTSRIGVIRFVNGAVQGNRIFIEGIGAMVEPAYMSSGRIGMVERANNESVHRALNTAQGVNVTLAGLGQIFP